MNSIETLRLRDEVEPYDFVRIEGALPTHILIDGEVASLAKNEMQKNQGFLEKLGRDLGVLRSQPAWEGWEGWGAGDKLKRAALHKAGWTFNDSHTPYEEAARAYEKVRQALLSPDCNSPADLLDLLS
ncbi:hypothetical protein [Pseudomonas juntendi]|uniref:Uncharacterized protein n=1 Tax=Pseudomonas juntendi TaxID=2666183 RepID=A0A7W2R0U0_9PSED|nr:hypothetical protein [Pseudomonas juntendi]MBA6133857.1 hypothetical protein [Pseudomonas juntendi]MBA6149215.1 hypothetical protein [Pseudomonas juntendi]